MLRRAREVGDDEHDDAHGDGGDDRRAAAGAHVSRVGQVPEPLAEDGEREQRGDRVGDRQREGEAAHAEGVDQHDGQRRC